MRGRTVETRRFASPQQRPGLGEGDATHRSALRAPRFPCQRDFGAAPRLASLRRRHEDAVPAQARPARHLVLNRLDDERAHAHRRTHRRARPRQYLGQVGGLLSRTRSHYPTLSKGGRPHQEMPLLAAQKWTATTVPGPDGRGIRENPHRTRRESCEVGGASHRPIGLGRDRAQPRSERPSVAGERCCKLPLESIEESQATTTSSVVSHEPRVPVTGSTRGEGSWHGDISQIGR